MKPDATTVSYHEQKYRIYLEMSQTQLKFIEMMKEI